MTAARVRIERADVRHLDALTPPVAQRLYEREGWIRDEEFYVYNYRLAPPTVTGPQE